ncbi:MAG: glycogen/starch/alpha-glucan phosphorylase [Methanocellales archaeon]
MTIVSITPDLALDIGYTYAGGLGTLEGDRFYGAAEAGLDYIVITFFYFNGYAKYEFNENSDPIPTPQPQPIEFINKLTPGEKFTVELKGEKVLIEPLEYKLGTAKAVFIKPISPEWAVKLVDRLYIEKDQEEKFYKYLLLAKAASEYIRRIGIEKIDYIDLQEAYVAILPLVLRIPGKIRLVIHTPGPWGHPSYPRYLFEREFGFKFVEENIVSTTLGLACAREGITVSAKHYDITSRVFPHFMDKLRYITNGICIGRWMDPELQKLYEKGKLELENFLEIKNKLRQELLKLISTYKKIDADEKMIVAWARRLVPYKRPEFITRFIEENRDLPIIFILGGKAHPFDGIGLRYMKKFKELSKQFENVVYFHDYDVANAKAIFKGADLLLFMPFSGWEACGTSFMKAGVNGVPTLASRDGAAIEFIVDGVNGWLFGTDLRELWSLEEPRSIDLNEREYEEFRLKFLEIINIFKSQPELYHKIALNAMSSFLPRVNIMRVLHEYYPNLIHIHKIPKQR